MQFFRVDMQFFRVDMQFFRVEKQFFGVDKQFFAAGLLLFYKLWIYFMYTLHANKGSPYTEHMQT